MDAAPEEGSELGPELLPDLAREMAEALARFMRADKGKWRIDFVFEDGRLTRWTRQEGPAGTHALEQFAT